MNKDLKVSVIMSVYNGEDYLSNSIDSILEQSYQNYEFIIINDASNDSTLEKLKHKAAIDSRIKIINNQTNRGLTKSLIKAINNSSGDIIVRQDVDEISFYNRIETLLTYFKNENISAVGSNSLDIYSKNLSFEWGYHSEDKILNIIRYKTIFPHGSSAFRKSDYMKIGGYDDKFITCQDFDLWNKLIKVGRIVMTEEILLKRYILKNSISGKRKFRQFYDSLRIRLKYKTKLIEFKIIYISIIYIIISLIPKKIYFFLKKIFKFIL